MEENETNLNDIFNKFNSILKDKDINLGEILENNNGEENSNSPEFNIDINTILKFKSIYNRINNNNSPRNRLLNSLKPFLRNSRKEKLDEYIKIANLIEVINLMNEINKGDI